MTNIVMRKFPLLAACALAAALCILLAQYGTGPAKAAEAADQKPAAQNANAPASGDLAPLDIKLPRPAYVGTPKNLPAHVKKPTGKPRPPFLAPKGCVNLALKRPVTSSDKEPVIGSLSQITDGDKEGTEGNWVELAPGLQWVQIDLGKKCAIYAIVVWHHHADPRVYHDVVIQVSDDQDFINDVKTVFNNDSDNSSGLGIGKDMEYAEYYEGELIDAKGVEGRYVRLYSRGNTSDDQNHYTEVEVWGIPK